jgi:hypothetical protein
MSEGSTFYLLGKHIRTFISLLLTVYMLFIGLLYPTKVVHASKIAIPWADC